MKKINLAIILSVILTVVSLFVKLVPCKTAPILANGIIGAAKWGLCSLGVIFSAGVSTSFFGITSNFILAVLLTLISWFIIWFFILGIFIKNKK